MSKSSGNVYNIRDILKKYDSDTLRLYLLSHHYREDIEFDEKDLEKMQEIYNDMREKAKSMEERRATKARRRDSGKVLGPFYSCHERRLRHSEGHSIHEAADNGRTQRKGPESSRTLLRVAEDNLEHTRCEPLWSPPMMAEPTS